MQRFELRVTREGDGHAVAVYEIAPDRARDLTGRRPRRLVARAAGAPVDEVMDTVRDWLREQGYKASTLLRNGGGPLEIPEELGVRLALLCAAVAPLRKSGRIEDIAVGLGRMTREEALYWYGKAHDRDRDRTLQALRILLAGEQRKR